MHAIQHPHERRPQQRPMQQIHREAHFPEKEEELARQGLLQHRRTQQDPQCDEFEAQAAAQPREVNQAAGPDHLHHVCKETRPGHPLGVNLREGGKGQADEDEEDREEGASAGTARNEGRDGVVILEVGEEDAPEELHPEGSYLLCLKM